MSGGASVRHRWIQAVRRSTLHPHARLIAFVYVEYVRKEDTGARRIWVAHDVLLRETGLTPNTLRKHRNTLIGLGWLVVTEAKRGPRPARYGLMIPPRELAAGDSSGPAGEGGGNYEVLTVPAPPIEAPGTVNLEPGNCELLTPELSAAHTKPPRNLSNHRTNLAFAVTSPRARPALEIEDEWAADDPWVRQQASEPDQPPPHAAAAIRVLTLVRSPIPEPDHPLCSHGVILGLTLGAGVLACCPTPNPT